MHLKVEIYQHSSNWLWCQTVDQNFILSTFVFQGIANRHSTVFKRKKSMKNKRKQTLKNDLRVTHKQWGNNPSRDNGNKVNTGCFLRILKHLTYQAVKM